MRMKIIFAMRSNAGDIEAGGNAGRGQRRSDATDVDSDRARRAGASPRNCAGRSSGNDTGAFAIGAPAPASCMPLLAPAGVQA